MTRVANNVGTTWMVQLRTHPLGCVCPRCQAQEARTQHRANAAAAEQAASLHRAKLASASPARPVPSAPTVTEVGDAQRQEATAQASHPQQAASPPPESAEHDSARSLDPPQPSPYAAANPPPGSRLSVKA